VRRDDDAIRVTQGVVGAFVEGGLRGTGSESIYGRPIYYFFVGEGIDHNPRKETF
jgi:hypothetical protein